MTLACPSTSPMESHTTNDFKYIVCLEHLNLLIFKKKICERMAQNVETLSGANIAVMVYIHTGIVTSLKGHSLVIKYTFVLCNKKA